MSTILTWTVETVDPKTTGPYYRNYVSNARKEKKFALQHKMVNIKLFSTQQTSVVILVLTSIKRKK